MAEVKPESTPFESTTDTGKVQQFDGTDLVPHQLVVADIDDFATEVTDAAETAAGDLFTAKFSWGDTEPVSPVTGDFWLDTT